MSSPQPPLNKTPARVDALRDVVFKLISYDPLRAVYIKSGQPVSGAKRRTLSEDLRGGGYIKPGSTTKVAPVELTKPQGEQLAVDWGLMPAPDAAAESVD